MTNLDHSLADVAERGSRIRTLEALRDFLANALDESSSKGMTVAALSSQFTDVLAQIDELQSAAGMSKRDELARKRDARRAAAGVANPADSGRAAGGN